MNNIANTAEKPNVAGRVILYILLIFALILTIKRFIFGLGSITNLNDSYPWGFWISFDILTGIALAAGGFTLTAGIYIWGNKKYHPLARPAILTAMLGYIFFVIALVIDLGRGLVMWHMFLPWMWQHHSVMFEVGWCVATYLTILIFEFLPSVLEKYNKKDLLQLWEKATPFIVIILLTLFTYAMTSSVLWAIVILAITALFEFLQMSGAIPKSRPVPILLIMSGVLLSCLHQSSLGSLFLIIPPNTLSDLWYSPALPVIFLLSAIMVGPAMVIFEGLLSAKIYKRRPELDLLSGLAKVMPFLLGIYLIVRIITLAIQGGIGAAFAFDTQSLMFLLEIVVGAIIPLVIFSMKDVARTEKGLFWGSLCTVIGVFLHRLNVSIIGLAPAGWETYRPAWGEYMVSLGVVAAGLLLFGYIVRNFPIYEKPLSPKAG